MSTLPGPRGAGPGGPPGNNNDSGRLMITMAISMGILLAYQTYFAPPAKKPDAVKPAETPAPAAPAAPAPGTPVEPGQAAPGTPPPAEDAPLPEQTVTLEGANLKLTLSSLGGRVTEALLPRFVEHEGKSKKSGDPVDLSSLKGADGGNIRLSFAGLLPNASYAIKEQSPTSVTFERTGGGWHVVRRYSFEPNGFGLRHEVEITNLTAGPLTIDPLIEMTGQIAHDERDRGGFLSMGMPTDQTTLLCETDSKLVRQTGVGLKEPVAESSPVHWAGIDRQYFLAAYIPRDGATKSCTASVDKERAHMALHYASMTIPPNQPTVLKADTFFGPKQEKHLKAADPRLENAVDYGWFGVLVRLLLALLLWFYQAIPNYGVCIFLLTLTVKLLTLPLSQKQYVSMQRMKDIQPKVKEMQDKYAHDKAMQGQKMMELYKEHGVNPAGGCLPMFIQMPIWIALYRTLYTSVELYQQPFVNGWIGDLTQKDPYYITPIVLGAVMLIQAFLTPQAQDNPQMKYMQYGMPVFFTFLMTNLPSGLTLYMVFNAVLTIFQQLYIKRRFGGPEGLKKKTA